MSIESESTREIEEQRQELLDEIAAEAEAGWEASNAPGSFGCHELLDRTSLLVDLLENQIVAHPACVARPEWFALAQQASSALCELYQQVGAEHLSVKAQDGESNGSA